MVSQNFFSDLKMPYRSLGMSGRAVSTPLSKKTYV